MRPDEELAVLVSQELINAGLIDARRQDELMSMLSAGTATIDDWRLWIELIPTDISGDARDAAN